MWAWQFSEDRVAARPHQCSKCNAAIGRGDCYKRTAIPPWGWECERGRYSTGLWTVIKLCYDCN